MENEQTWMRKNIIQRNVHVIQEIFVQKSKLKNSPCIIIIISIQKMLLLSLAEHACRSLTFKSKSKWRHSIWIWKSVDFSGFFFLSSFSIYILSVRKNHFSMNCRGFFFLIRNAKAIIDFYEHISFAAMIKYQGGGGKLKKKTTCGQRALAWSEHCKYIR